MPKSARKVKIKVQILKQYLSNLKQSRKTYLIVLLLGITILILTKRSWFIAATVNGQPITNFELLYKMNQQYRQQTLNQLIDEKIIFEEIRKNKILVTNNEIEKKYQEIEGRIGSGDILDSLLAQQGQSKKTFKEQIKLQLAIERLYSQEATVSAEETDQFLKKNTAQLQATTSAEQGKEAKQLLIQQKLGQVFREKFQQLKQQAKVRIF